MNAIVQNLRVALRQLRHSPAFALTAILTLALGIGANTAIFSLLDQALLRTLPVRDPGQLVTLQDTGTVWDGSISVSGGDQKDVFTYPAYKNLRDRNQVFSSLAAVVAVNGINLTHDNSSRLANSELVSGNYFTTLGVKAALGRVFSQADDGVPLANPVAVLSFDYWKDHLGADPSIVGSTVAINSFPYQIIGVAAPGFHSAVWGQTPDLFFPLAMLDQVIPGNTQPNQPPRLQDSGFRWLSLIGRLKPGISPNQAQADLAPLWHALRANDLKALGTRSNFFVKGYLTNSRLLVQPGARGFAFNRDSLEKPFLAVMAMALLVLLISAVNVASLLLVRAAARNREFALRSALGASSTQIMGQLLLEGMLLGLLGGAVGLLLAPTALRTLVAFLAVPDTESGFSASLDWRVLIFNFAIAIFVSLCFSLVPALQLRKLDLSSTLREGRSTGAGGMLNLRRLVVCVQVGLSVLLLMASGIFLRTLHNLRSVDVGFNTSHLVTFDVDPALAGYKTATVPALHDRIQRTLSQLPGVLSVGATDSPELAGSNSYTTIKVAGYPDNPEVPYQIEIESVTPTFFQTLQIPLLAGRLINDGDTPDHPKVAVVNATFAKHYCGSAQACIGRMMGSNNDTSKLDRQIIGVVRDSHHTGVRDKIVPAMYWAYKQRPQETDIQFYLRTIGDPAQSLNLVHRAMQSLDPSLSVGSLISVDEQIDRNLQNDRLIAVLAISFGVLATLLAGVGLYGVLAYSTAQRVREIGIRMALGSTRIAASMLILSDVLKLAALGVVIAIPVGITLSRLVRAQLYEVSAADPAILASVVSLITLIALLAALVPARRAASINPTEALRTE